MYYCLIDNYSHISRKPFCILSLLERGSSATRNQVNPVSRIEFTLKSSVCWPIIGFGTRTWSVAMRCRDPAVQSEFFVRVSCLKTFNWMYCYRVFIVGIVVSAISISDWLAIFRLAVFIARQIVHWPIYTLDLRVNSNHDTGSSPLLLPFRRLGIFVLSIDAPIDPAVI